ncbi:hypothetical protein KEJ39_01040 [Candidatus Bathyarchaeota archaeon]|nr:hypothetical protein [Candidatus Bathyarchaeota archaeon]
MRIRLFHLLVLAILLLSVSMGLFYDLSYYAARTSLIETKEIDHSQSEDLAISCVAVNTSYVAGEKAVFYFEVVNLRNETIRRIDYTLRVTALSLLGLRLLETSEYSTRTYMMGVTERLVVERDLPTITPSGFYALQIVAKPEGLDPLEPCELVIYISGSNYLMGLLTFALLLSSSLYGLLTVSAYVRRVGLESVRPNLRNFASTLHSLDFCVEHVENRSIEVLHGFSIGQRFIFSAICSLLLAGFSLALRLHGLADQLAILTYFALVIGVGNLFWENYKEARPPRFRLPFPLRLTLSLFLLTVLLYLSLPAVSTAFVVASCAITAAAATDSIFGLRRRSCQ